MLCRKTKFLEPIFYNFMHKQKYSKCCWDKSNIHSTFSPIIPGLKQAISFSYKSSALKIPFTLKLIRSIILRIRIFLLNMGCGQVELFLLEALSRKRIKFIMKNILNNCNKSYLPCKQQMPFKYYKQ